LFAKTFGCCRFVYNWALNLKITAYKERKETLGNVELTNLMKSELKAEYEWLTEVNSQSLQSALRNLDTAGYPYILAAFLLAVNNCISIYRKIIAIFSKIFLGKVCKIKIKHYLCSVIKNQAAGLKARTI